MGLGRLGFHYCWVFIWFVTKCVRYLWLFNACVSWVFYLSRGYFGFSRALSACLCTTPDTHVMIIIRGPTFHPDIFNMWMRGHVCLFVLVEVLWRISMLGFVLSILQPPCRAPLHEECMKHHEHKGNLEWHMFDTSLDQSYPHINGLWIFWAHIIFEDRHLSPSIFTSTISMYSPIFFLQSNVLILIGLSTIS